MNSNNAEHLALQPTVGALDYPSAFLSALSALAVLDRVAPESRFEGISRKAGPAVD